MPRIPIVDGPQVSQRALPATRLDADPIGGQIGAEAARNLSTIAAGAHQLEEQERERADQIAVQEAVNRAREAQQAIMHDPARGALRTRGKDAFSVPSAVWPVWDERTGAIRKGLTSRRQVDAFDRAAADLRLQMNGDLNRHVAAESDRYEDETFEGALAGHRAAAGAARRDAGRIGSEMGAGEKAIDEYAARRGLPGEWRDNAKRRFVSAIHAQQIEGLLADGDDPGAAAWFKQHGDELLPDARTQAAKAVEVGGLRGKSQRLVDEVMRQGPDILPQTIDRGLATIARLTKDDPRLREETEQRFVRMMSLRRQAENDRADNDFVQAYGALTAPGNLRGLDAVEPAVLARLKPEHDQALRRHAAAMARREEPTTNRLVYAGLEQMAARDPQAFARPATLLAHAADLSNEDFKHFSRLQREIIEKGASGTLMTGIRSREDVVNEMLAGVGIDPRPIIDGKLNEPAARFRQQIDRMIVAEQEVTKKQVPPDKVREFADRLLVEQTVQRARWRFNPARLGGSDFYDEKVRAFEVPGAERLAFTAAQVPAAERARIMESAQRQGLRLTDEQVMAIYNAAQQKAIDAGP